jgi:hypothetical protein
MKIADNARIILTANPARRSRTHPPAVLDGVEYIVVRFSRLIMEIHGGFDVPTGLEANGTAQEVDNKRAKKIAANPTT